MRYWMTLAGRTALVETFAPLRPTAESVPFLRPLPEGEAPAADLTVRLRPVRTLEPLPPGGHWEADQYFLSGPAGMRIYTCALRGRPPYAVTEWHRGERTVECRCLEDRAGEYGFMRSVWTLTGVETLLLTGGGLLLHAALIRTAAGAVAFTAPPGTGKSTQAELWRRHRGADILNGDRAGLMPREDGWGAWGLPCAGSSGIYRNEGAPLAAVAVVRRSPDNRVTPLGPARAFAALLPEICVHRWDRDFTEEAVTALEALVTRVPVYTLECRPDRGAVEALAAALEKGRKQPW